MKVRHCLYFDEKVSAELEALTSKPGTSKSDVVNAALQAFFQNRGADQLDVRLRPRLDRLSDHLGRIERDQQIVLETLALFIRFQLTISAPLPANQLSAMQAAGNERYQSFIDQVSRKLAKGAAFSSEIIERAEDQRDDDEGAK